MQPRNQNMTSCTAVTTQWSPHLMLVIDYRHVENEVIRNHVLFSWKQK